MVKKKKKAGSIKHGEKKDGTHAKLEEGKREEVNLELKAPDLSGGKLKSTRKTTKGEKKFGIWDPRKGGSANSA